MATRAYTNEDGTVRDEVLEKQASALAEAEREYGIDSDHLDSLISTVQEEGYVILPNLLSPEEIETIRREADPLLEHDGRTEFEGYKTRRIYSVIEKTLSCNPVVEHPLVMALLDRLFMPNYLLSQLQVIKVMPGEIRQPLHHDDGFYPLPRPRKPIGAALIWALDDFREDNGATLVYPKAIYGEMCRLPTSMSARWSPPSCRQARRSSFWGPCGIAPARTTATSHGLLPRRSIASPGRASRRTTASPSRGNVQSNAARRSNPFWDTVCSFRSSAL